MAWTTPTLSTVRRLVRDAIAANLRGADATVQNSVLRVLSDATAGVAHLVLKYVDWVAKQLLPDTAENEWLRRWADILLIAGPKAASFAAGTAVVSGIEGTLVPMGARLVASNGAGYQVSSQTTIGPGGGTIEVQSLIGGVVGNQLWGATLSFTTAVAGLDAQAVVVSLSGGADAESTEELRGRVLDHIRKPPMGGDADDYVAWALEFPGVTRAWCAPLEMGIGTVTVRFMMDDVRVNQGGFPNEDDAAALLAYLDAKRPVSVLDLYVVSPVPEPVSFTLSDLVSDDNSTLANIEAKVREMLKMRAAPAYAKNGVTQEAQTIYASWVSEAVSSADGADHFDLIMADHVMPSPGHMAVLGNIVLA
jgi:uncharacterized phage protein gp47/JayE